MYRYACMYLGMCTCMSCMYVYVCHVCMYVCMNVCNVPRRYVCCIPYTFSHVSFSLTLTTLRALQSSIQQLVTLLLKEACSFFTTLGHTTSHATTTRRSRVLTMLLDIKSFLSLVSSRRHYCADSWSKVVAFIVVVVVNAF